MIHGDNVMFADATVTFGILILGNALFVCLFVLFISILHFSFAIRIKVECMTFFQRRQIDTMVE